MEVEASAASCCHMHGARARRIVRDGHAGAGRRVKAKEQPMSCTTDCKLPLRSFRPLGAGHHAQMACASGWCLFSNVAVAARHGPPPQQR